jgi:glycosyltransferase involved in cell wall biosynthesis
MPYFSIIIPVYNKVRFIKETINSVLAQTFTDFELIIINDGSTDGSEKAITAFIDPRIKYFTQQNQGVSAARNLGISKASADYITFLDADDIWNLEFLEEMRQLIRDYPSEKVYSAAIETESAGRIIPAKYSLDITKGIQVVNYFTASLRETIICTSCAVFHREVFETAGDFDKTLKSGEDTDLWIRIGLRYNVVFNPKILARYVYSEDSLSKRTVSDIDLDKYSAAEPENKDLQNFLDLNRFSLAIKAKLSGEKARSRALASRINLKHLSFKKQLLLKLPACILRKLLAIQKALVQKGFASGNFK